MFDTLPKHYDDVKDWGWAQFEPYFADLEARELTAENVNQYLLDLTALSDILSEILSRARVATTQNTRDADAEARLKDLMKNVYQPALRVDDRLNRKLLASGLTPENYEIPLKKARVSVEIFREDNLPLMLDEQQVGLEYAKVTGAQTATWDGEEVTLLELAKSFQDPDRDRRKAAFDLYANRWLQDRETINRLWQQAFEIRQKIARNAGFANYRDFQWQTKARFDYGPADNETFHNAIAEVVVPAAVRARERRRQRLGVDTLRPYDIDVDASGQPPLKPWETIEQFADTSAAVFAAVDPELGAQYEDMKAAGNMDLPNRKHKGPGAYCTGYPLTGKPFVFMNAVGNGGDVRTLLHEVGHAFHNYATRPLPYAEQREYPIEFAEVASFGMELLAAPYITKAYGGYFTEAEAARYRIEHLESIIEFWPYMAMVDAFQLWAYNGGSEGGDPEYCDETWLNLKARFEPDIDYSGYEQYQATGWHRKQHIFRYPMYYIEYGLARLGAVQVFANARKDQAAAVKAYRNALALGGTRNLHELFAAAGAQFKFDTDTLSGLINTVEETIEELQQQL